MRASQRKATNQNSSRPAAPHPLSMPPRPLQWYLTVSTSFRTLAIAVRHRNCSGTQRGRFCPLPRDYRVATTTGLCASALFRYNNSISQWIERAGWGMGPKRPPPGQEAQSANCDTLGRPIFQAIAGIVSKVGCG